MVFAFSFDGLLGNDIARSEEHCCCGALGDEWLADEERTAFGGLALSLACGRGTHGLVFTEEAGHGWWTRLKSVVSSEQYNFDVPHMVRAQDYVTTPQSIKNVEEL